MDGVDISSWTEA